MSVSGMSSEEASQRPEPFAMDWVQAAGRDQVDFVWSQMAADFRLAMTQAWLSRNAAAVSDPSAAGFDRDSLAARLSAPTPQHPLFQHLARVSLREIVNVFAGLDPDLLGAGTRPRPVGPNLELVRLFYLPDLDRDRDGNYVFAPGATARAVSVLVERTDSAWAVAGVGDGILHPGWPPTYETLVAPED